MKNAPMRKQIAQLSILTAVHFLIDSFAGMPSVLLPVIRDRFSLTLTKGVILIAVLDITCNMGQILTGHMRAEKIKPMFLQIGLVLASLISLIAFVPGSIAFYALNVIFFLAGCGIAIAHPEGLRGIHTIESIPAPVTTAVFMTGGFLGFSSGGYIASLFISGRNLEALAFMLVFPAIALALLYFSHIKLSVETETLKQTTQLDHDEYPFWTILLMSLPITIASTTLVRLLPSRLNELNFSLEFGGLSVLLYGVGSAAGSLAWAAVAHKKGVMKTSIVLLFAGAPFLAMHQMFISRSWAILLLVGGGFFSASAYSLIVTLCRKAHGLKLGQRMGFVVGGSWGFASLILIGLSKPADLYGIEKILPVVPICFAISGLIGLILLAKHKQLALKNTQ